MTGAVFDHAEASHLSLILANAEGASFVGALLDYSSMREANMKNTNLCGANLSKSDTDDADFTGATYDSHTQMSFDPEERGMKKVD